MNKALEKLKKVFSSLSPRECAAAGVLVVLAAFLVPMFITAAVTVLSAPRSEVPENTAAGAASQMPVETPAAVFAETVINPQIAQQEEAEALQTPALSGYAYSYYAQEPVTVPDYILKPEPAAEAYNGLMDEEIYIPPVYGGTAEAVPAENYPQQYTYPQESAVQETLIQPEAVYQQESAAEQNAGVYSSDELPRAEMLPRREAGEFLTADEISVESVARELEANVSANMPGSVTSLEITSAGSIRVYAIPAYGAAPGALTWNLGPNGRILNKDGTESDIYPIEENGTLSCGVRRVTIICDVSGRRLSDTPSWGSEGVDYFTEDYQEKVELFNSNGQPREELGLDISNGGSDSSEFRAGWQFINGKVYFFSVDGTPVKGLKLIDGKYYLFDSTGIKADSIGVDVSCFNGYIDWNLLKSEGVDFAIIRVAGRTWGTGRLFEDSEGIKNLLSAKSAGIEVGAYVYSNAITPEEARQEAELACGMISRAGVSLDFPLYIDLEHSGDYPNGRADSLGAAKRSEIADVFCQSASSQGIRAGVYASSSFWQNELSYGMLSGYPAWVANYNSSFTNPAYPPHGMWQFSAYGRLSGCSELLDLNAIF